MRIFIKNYNNKSNIALNLTNAVNTLYNTNTKTTFTSKKTNDNKMNSHTKWHKSKNNCIYKRET